MGQCSDGPQACRSKTRRKRSYVRSWPICVHETAQPLHAPDTDWLMTVPDGRQQKVIRFLPDCPSSSRNIPRTTIHSMDSAESQRLAGHVPNAAKSFGRTRGSIADKRHMLAAMVCPP